MKSSQVVISFSVRLRDLRKGSVTLWSALILFFSKLASCRYWKDSRLVPRNSMDSIWFSLQLSWRRKGSLERAETSENWLTERLMLRRCWYFCSSSPISYSSFSSSTSVVKTKLDPSERIIRIRIFSY